MFVLTESLKYESLFLYNTIIKSSLNLHAHRKLATDFSIVIAALSLFAKISYHFIFWGLGRLKIFILQIMAMASSFYAISVDKIRTLF